jgi:hypothetical protein
MSLMRLEHLEHIAVVYNELSNFMKRAEQQQALQELVEHGW